MDINAILIIVLIIVILLAAMFFIPQWRLKRAIRQVIQIFRHNNAVDTKTARTADELGLKPRSIMEGMFKGRDYRQYALNALTKAGIVQTTEGGRLYLSEDRLMGSGLEKGSAYLRR